MGQKSSQGITFFLIAVVIFTAIIALSFVRQQKEPELKQGWGKLAIAEGRLQLRTYLFLRHISRKSPAANLQQSNDVLQAVVDPWQSALDANPNDYNLRFALAVVQAQLGKPAAPTLEKVPAAYSALKTLVLEPVPDPALLEKSDVMTFIERNPARRLWLASIYTKLGEQEQAAQQWRLGYQESAPFAISVLVLNMLAWLFLPLLSIICIIILKRHKLLPPKEAAPPAEFAPESVEIPPLNDRAPSLSEASEVFLIWLVAQFVVGGPLVLIAQHFWPHVGQALVATAVSGIAALLAVGWLRLRTNEKVIAGWKFAPFGAFLMLAAAIFLLSPIGQGIAYIIQQLTGLKPQEPSLLLVSTAQSLPMRIILIFMVCCIVPAAEETIFRGLLYRGLRKQWGPLAGMVISSILFSLGHQDILSALPLFILAMGLAWSVERTGSIVPAVLAHALFNLFPILLLNIMTL